jgi:hypothetical protein
MISPHRLLVSPDRWARLRALPAQPLLTRAAAKVAADADRYAADRTIPVEVTGHNWHLIRARRAQTRIVTLLVHYGITGDRGFRDAALDYVRDMAGWEYWSWIKWREQIADPDAIFDLSYGENSATLAWVIDWLAGELTDNERALLRDTARRRALQPYLARNGTPGQEMWYYRSGNCNWNTVCNGGAGLLALALGDTCPESAPVLALVEEGIRHYFEFLQEDGAWPEGIGYWGYGHRYGYQYLLSHERATGRPHPLLQRPGSRNTLRFPFLFSPNGVPVGFGDSNHFFPLPFIYAAAERYGMPEVVAEMDRRMTVVLEQAAHEDWPNTAELLLCHPGVLPAIAADPWPRAAVQQGIEWGYLADAWPTPALYAAVRGGTTDAPHTHQDLGSVNVVVGDEPLLDNVREDDYLDTTFSERRFELYEMGAASKNVMLINGVGLPHPGTAATRLLSGADWDGILLDARQAASVGSPVHLYGRLVLLLAGRALLILDRACLAHAALGEVRFHTRAQATPGETTTQIQGKAATLHVAYAADVPCVLRTSLGTPTNPDRAPQTILRWMTRGKQTDMLFATLLTPAGEGRVTLDAAACTVTVTAPGVAMTFAHPAGELGIEKVG